MIFVPGTVDGIVHEHRRREITASEHHRDMREVRPDSVAVLRVRDVGDGHVNRTAVWKQPEMVRRSDPDRNPSPKRRADGWAPGDPGER